MKNRLIHVTPHLMYRRNFRCRPGDTADVEMIGSLLRVCYVVNRLKPFGHPIDLISCFKNQGVFYVDLGKLWVRSSAKNDMLDDSEDQ